MLFDRRTNNRQPRALVTRHARGNDYALCSTLGPRSWNMRNKLLVTLIVILTIGALTLAISVPQIGKPPTDEGTGSSTVETPADSVVVYDPYASGGQWFKGQMHCHSTQSDGAGTVCGLLIRRPGYDFIALTDLKVPRVTGSILVLGRVWQGFWNRPGRRTWNCSTCYVPYKYSFWAGGWTT